MLKRNDDCLGKIVDFSPEFSQPTILLIASVEGGKTIEPEEIPKKLGIINLRFVTYLFIHKANGLINKILSIRPFLPIPLTWEHFYKAIGLIFE